jgi:hypothetical protein
MLGTALRVTKELAANRTLERLATHDPERWNFVRDSLGLTMGARVPIAGLLPHCQCKSAPLVGLVQSVEADEWEGTMTTIEIGSRDRVWNLSLCCSRSLLIGTMYHKLAS